MYVAKGSGLEVYETFEELLNKGITNAWDYQGKYYILVNFEDQYDNRIWIVDKQTKRVSHMSYVGFFELMDKAKQIDPATLKRAV